MRGGWRIQAKLILVQLLTLLGIGACLAALPVCDARAYAPAISGDDVRTVTEARTIVTVETEPGTHILHQAGTPDPSCKACSAPANDPHDPIMQATPFAERFALLAITSPLARFDAAESSSGPPEALHGIAQEPIIPPPRG